VVKIEVPINASNQFWIVLGFTYCGWASEIQSTTNFKDGFFPNKIMGCLPSNPINNGMFTIYQLVIRWPIHRKKPENASCLGGAWFLPE
jgi:hypothetical protein